jgi:hypothetical protein
VAARFRSPVASRGARIRTGDPLLPKQVRYRTAPRPEMCTSSRSSAVFSLPAILLPDRGVYVSVHVGIMLLYLPEFSRLQNDSQHSGFVGMLVGSLQRLHRPPATRGGYVRGR